MHSPSVVESLFVRVCLHPNTNPTHDTAHHDIITHHRYSTHRARLCKRFEARDFCATTFGYTKHDRILDMLYEQISAELSLEVAHTTKKCFLKSCGARVGSLTTILFQFYPPPLFFFNIGKW